MANECESGSLGCSQVDMKWREPMISSEELMGRGGVLNFFPLPAHFIQLCPLQSMQYSLSIKRILGL